MLSERAVIRLAWPTPSAVSYSVRPLAAEGIGQVVRRLQELIELPGDWDEQGGVAPDTRTAVCSAAIIAYCMAAGAPLPEIDATTTGAIHAEWYKDASLIELEVASPTEATLYYRFEDASGWEGSFWSVRSSLEQVFSRFR
jgi:hypothetical protein